MSGSKLPHQPASTHARAIEGTNGSSCHSSKNWISDKWKRVSLWLGFKRTYNLPLFIILAGAMLGFCLARITCLDVSNRWSKSASPGEWYWYQRGHYKIGITLHLCTVIPAGILLIWQFVPAIRYHAMLFHRINGYIVIILVLLGNVGALMIARHAFGGDLSTQGGVGLLAIMTTLGIVLAYYNVKRLQIEQHRAWMLRSTAYLGTIITTRLIMIIASQVISKIGGYYAVMTCGEIYSLRGAGYISTKYPSCMPTTNTTLIEEVVEKVVPVLVQFGTNVEEVGASLRLPFGMALWLAIFLHAFGAELYLALTPREAERLRVVSYERQLEAGFANPGSAGIVIERYGDSDSWKPPMKSPMAG